MTKHIELILSMYPKLFALKKTPGIDINSVVDTYYLLPYKGSKFENKIGAGVKNGNCCMAANLVRTNLQAGPH